MGKSFVMAVIIIAVIGFSASAYIFSQNDIISGFNEISDNTSAKKAQIMNEISECVTENTIGSSGTHFNSFEKNFLENIINKIENTDDEEDLDKIAEQFYSISACKGE
ncbi:MAG: hypothetical protein QF864_04480 [SAR202 cluster bacterium]|jgi:predicted transcriptional regulator|nr:hypothetical protein [SAR202 cluster bacterium]